MLVALLLACSTASSTDSADTGDSAEALIPPPTIAWLSPSEGDTVAADTALPCSVVVDAFTLVDPAKHNEGAPTGYVQVAVDGQVLFQTGSTTFEVTLAGSEAPHVLDAALFYDDGDAIAANAERLCGEDDPDTTCLPVSASISVTAIAQTP
jgi:hypothetical protein